MKTKASNLDEKFDDGKSVIEHLNLSKARRPAKTPKKKDAKMRAEYDFSKGERGKFYRPLDKGYTVHVTKKDGTVEVNHYKLAEGTVLLAPDVLEYFSDSESVNEALRSLIHLMEKVPARKYGVQRTSVRQVAERKQSK